MLFSRVKAELYALIYCLVYEYGPNRDITLCDAPFFHPEVIKLHVERGAQLDNPCFASDQDIRKASFTDPGWCVTQIYTFICNIHIELIADSRYRSLYRRINL